ncbi:MAG: YhcG family protein [Muribaculaceae bacterium]
METIVNRFDNTDIISAVKAIKTAILSSRYNAARLANREQLTLYFNIGEFISRRSRTAQWGASAITSISKMLQQELPGLRGFSESGIKRMRTFYEGWSKYISKRPKPSDAFNCVIESIAVLNRPMALDDFTEQEMEWFLSIGFSHHYDILIKTHSLQERLYYIRRCATEFWSVEKLRYMMKSAPYSSELSSNTFESTIRDADLRASALRAFKDEYLLDFINVEDPDIFDERILESQIVHNIKNFIMAFGNDFAFMGNQYRVIVSGKEYFIDLLFYHRRLRCLVAIELKKNEFKAEYAGKLNLYLSALDEYVKNPDENPSIGIILCRDKDEKTVQFAFRGVTTPMGVAKYKTADELPPEIRSALPSADDLKKLL